MEKNKYINWDLLVRHMSGELSKEEEIVFKNWIKVDEKHRKYYERMVEEWNRETLYERDLPRILSNFDLLLETQRKKRKLVIRKRVISWSVAAALIIGFGTLLLLSRQQSEMLTVASSVVITPGESKAYLVMYDGTNIQLDKTTDSSNLIVGSTKIRNNKGTVTFIDNDKLSQQMEYNTLVIPRNGEYHIVLNDGTEVWLNAESKLKFPTDFKGDERRVFLSGEAYFKVSYDNSHPFIVETDLGNIKVYGTEFNVRRYTDEQTVRTTLVNGSVGFQSKESVTENYVKIDSGYQISYERGEDVVVKKVKVANEIAWHKQLFCFERCTLEEIMKDVARWYDVKVTFDNENLKGLSFTCTLDRYDEIEKLLRFFEEVYNIEFKIEGKHITVMEQ